MLALAAEAALDFLVPCRALEARMTRAGYVRSEKARALHPYDCSQHDAIGIRIRSSPAVHSRSLSRAASGLPIRLSCCRWS